MSRVGKRPIPIPEKVKIDLQGNHIKVTGPKGELERDLPVEITVNVGEAEIEVTRPNETAPFRALHGLTRALINNMVEGVTNGFAKELKVEGVGYRASMQGKSLNLSVGFSHPVVVEPPEGVTFAVEGTQNIKVSGIDKELVGQTASNIRAWRKPEPYKGKGIRYVDERVRRKVGKAGAK